MNILYLLGNGYDVNLKLKTKYTDFYKYYLKIENNDYRVKALKKTLSSKIELWSDLEIALGQYLKNIDNTEDFDIIFEDIGDELINYLQTVEDNFIANKPQIDINKLVNDFMNPEQYLRVGDKRIIDEYKKGFKSNINNIDIITFNYTKILENIFHPLILNKSYNYNNSKYKFRSITHIHGTLNDRTVLGVNDLSQIENDNFKNNLDIREAIIKPLCNKVQKHDVDSKCKSLIRQAQLICIFGSSIGKTDQLWWDLISNKILKDKSKLIIFNRSKQISNVRAYKQSRLERDQRNLFAKQNTNEIANDNIVFSYNSEMFNVINNDKNET